MSIQDEPVDPATMIDGLRTQLLHRAGEACGPAAAERLAAGIEAAHERVADLVRHEQDRWTVGFAVLAAAGFQALAGGMGERACLRMLEEVLVEQWRAPVLAGTRAMLDAAPDPFRALVDISRAKELHAYGPSFSFTRPVDDGTAYVLDIERCLFHEVLRRLAATRLQPLLCRADANWADAIDPERHRTLFVRPSTFATGDRCRMCFLRTDGEPAPLAGEHDAA